MDDVALDVLARRMRAAVVDRLLAAYEEAGMQGLCAEGRFEYAVDQARNVDPGPVIQGFAAQGPPAGNDGSGPGER